VILYLPGGLLSIPERVRQARGTSERGKPATPLAAMPVKS
jgi:hypothetical protein